MHFVQRLVHRRIIIDLRFAIVKPRFAPKALFLCQHHDAQRYFYEIESSLVEIHADNPAQQLCSRCSMMWLKQALARCSRCRRYVVPLRLLDASFVKPSDLWELSSEEAERILQDEHQCDPRDYKPH